MSVKNGRDYLYLIWKNPDTRRQYIVGTLSKNGLYEFKYGVEFVAAQKTGFKGLEAFKDFNKTYKSERLFPVFSSRLPDRKRKGISEILKKYGLSEYDEYMLLKNSGARLPIDTLEFIDPLLDDDKPVSKNFYIAGSRHYLPCRGDNCINTVNVKEGDRVSLLLEPENPKDQNAVVVIGNHNEKLGYIPRYYAQQVTSMIKKGKELICEITEVNQLNCCRECIKVHLYTK